MKKNISRTAAFISAVFLTATAGFAAFPESAVSQSSVQAGTVEETKVSEVTEITRRTCDTIGTVSGLSDPRKLIYPVSGTFDPVICIGEFALNSEGESVFYNIENVDCTLVQMENGKIIKEFARWNTSEEPQKVISDVEYNFESKYDCAYYIVLMENLPDNYYYETGFYSISYSPHELMYDIPYKTDGMIIVEPVSKTDTIVTSNTSPVSVSDIPDISSETPITMLTYEPEITSSTDFVHIDYATKTEYDSSPMKIGETRAVRFWNPENMTSELQYFYTSSHNFDYSYEEGSDTIYITAKEAGEIDITLLAGTAFSGSVHLTVTEEVYSANDATVPVEIVGAGSKQIMYGDLDENRTVDLSDLTILSQHTLKDKILEGEKYKAADCNGDGTVDITDIALLKQYIMHDDVKLGPSGR